jgi:hypothetical protein
MEEQKGHISKYDKLHSQVNQEIKEKWEQEQNALKLKLVEED